MQDHRLDCRVPVSTALWSPPVSQGGEGVPRCTRTPARTLSYECRILSVDASLSPETLVQFSAEAAELGCGRKGGEEAGENAS